jgi:hypothetical protein
VPEPREARSLVPLEVVAVLAIAAAPLPELVPAALPLLVAGSLSRWVRGRSWADAVRGGWAPNGDPLAADPGAWRHRLAVGALAGLAAVACALLAGAPMIEALALRSVEWSSYPVVRGNASLFAMIAVYVAVAAVAAELALRGWIVERVLELSPGPPILPVLAGAFAEALITPGDLAARLGGGLFGAGLGWMYAAGGRSVVAPICARIVFQLGLLLLEATRLVG